jgi:PTS system cellobiose-specific IIC component
MLPFNLSMGVMTFFISVGIGASLGVSLTSTR